MSRRWLYIPYDQLNCRFGPLSREEPESLGVVLIESGWHLRLRPYHKQKIALLLANQRHFALELRQRGVQVFYLKTDEPIARTLKEILPETGTMRVMRPAERELRAHLQPLFESGGLMEIPHEGWLTSVSQFSKSVRNGPQFRMGSFYALVRKETGILMEGALPVGGKFSFDAENRLPWNGEPPAPEAPHFPIDSIKESVCDLVESQYSGHPGALDIHSLAATVSDANFLWRWAREKCLPQFGPYEDAMSFACSGLFHTRISALMNIHRLLPQEVILQALDMEIPIQSKEGFIRQILGWREYVHHVHEFTDGFRKIGNEDAALASAPGDGAWSGWTGRSWELPPGVGSEFSPALHSALKTNFPLPPTYWGKPSGLQCLDKVVSDVWLEAYSHHITRLMVLGNIASLLGVNPRELTDWFWAAYSDAYDWVVEPNVLGMGTYALGDLMTTKPYVSGAPYLNRMSDYCRDCRFDPKTNCPLTPLYWSFLERNRVVLTVNPRVSQPLNSAAKRSSRQKELDNKILQVCQDTLKAGETLTPEKLNNATSEG